MLDRLFGSVFGGHLRRIWRGFARALEAHHAGRRPGNRVALVSVMVTMVLLKVAATWATPTTTFFFSFLRARRGFAAGFLASAMLLGDFLFAGDRFGRAFAGAGVGVSALAANRQALAVTQAAIAA